MAYPLPLAIFLAFSLLLPGGDNGLVRAEDTAIKTPGSELLLRQKKMQRLQDGIDTQKKLITRTQNTTRGLMAELEEYDHKIAVEEEKLAIFSEQIAEQEAKIDSLEKELADATEIKNHSGKLVEHRLAAYYRLGSTGFLNAAFSSRSLHDLLQFNEYYRYLIRHDRQIMDGFRQTTNILAAAIATVTTEKEQLGQTLAEASVQKETLAAARSQRLALIDRVNTEKSLHQQALSEIEEAASRLTEKMAVLKEDAAREKTEKSLLQHPPEPVNPTSKEPLAKEPATGETFASRKGLLPLPVEGMVTTFFGQSKQGKFGIALTSDGIDIQTAPGATLAAVYPGSIVYDGELRGYGRLVIIDHGNQYYSLISRAAEFSKQKGDQVEAGETIGVAPQKGNALLEGVHFEIRHGTTPLDPLDWLDRKKLKMAAPVARQ